jgi:hypothetical protein
MAFLGSDRLIDGQFLAGQRHFGFVTSTKRKRVNELRQIHSLALRASKFQFFELRVALSS